MREAILLRAARSYADLMSDAERADLDRRIVRLEQDPAVDEQTTFGLPGVSGLFLYDDGVWRMAYTVPDDATILIRSITHVLDLPECSAPRRFFGGLVLFAPDGLWTWPWPANAAVRPLRASYTCPGPPA